MAETIDSREEQQLLTAVKKASDLVAGGLSPDDAVAKVAKDNGFGPGKIRLIGQAYNTGQQLSQWRSPGSTSILDKLASFELCDPDAVVEKLFPAPTEKVAEVIDPSYSRRPVFPAQLAMEREKQASYVPVVAPVKHTASLQRRMDVAYSNIRRAKQAYDAMRRDATTATDALRVKVENLVTYFRKQAFDRLPFSAVEDAAVTYMGGNARGLLDIVHQRLPYNEKRASDSRPIARGPIDLNAEPFSTISSAIQLAGVIAQREKLAAELRGAWEAAKVDELRPFVSEAAMEAADHNEKVAFGIFPEIGAIAAGDILAHKATHAPEHEDDPYGDVSSLDSELAMIRKQSQNAIGHRRKTRTKQAFFLPSVAAGISAGMGRTLGTVTKTRNDLVDDAWMGLEDPEHENELRKIRAHALINQLMTDPDDPISGHDPDKVLQAYNEISQAAPRVAETAATLRPALRKRLEGHTEPFESKELLDVEHGLSRSKSPTPNTNILSGNAPEGMFG